MIEEWRPVCDHYDISDYGRVRSWIAPRGRRKVAKIFTGRPDRHGYRRVNMHDKDRFIHQLVLEAFVGPRPKDHGVAHNNGVPSDNRLSNLRWSTHMDNQHDKKAHGTENIGSRHGMSRLTENDVIEIRRLWQSGHLLQRDIATLYNVQPNLVSRIVNRVLWTHIP